MSWDQYGNWIDDDAIRFQQELEEFHRRTGYAGLEHDVNAAMLQRIGNDHLPNADELERVYQETVNSMGTERMREHFFQREECEQASRILTGNATDADTDLILHNMPLDQLRQLFKAGGGDGEDK